MIGSSLPAARGSWGAAFDPPPARCRPDWVRFATWGVITAVSLVWATTLGWLLVQGVAWALERLA